MKAIKARITDGPYKDREVVLYKYDGATVFSDAIFPRTWLVRMVKQLPGEISNHMTVEAEFLEVLDTEHEDVPLNLVSSKDPSGE